VSKMPKRKRQDEIEQVDILPRLNPLAPDHIENEYEYLDNDDDPEEEVPSGSKLGNDELSQIMNAQKPATIRQDGDIKITPFNLSEELEEGEFDKAGNFIFKKGGKSDEEHEGGNDTWAESIDWKEVERREKEKDPELTLDRSKESTIPIRDEQTCFKEMLRIMRPDETVQRAIRRLGNSIPRKRPTNRNTPKGQNHGASSNMPKDQAQVEEAKRKLDLMTELANQVFLNGDTDIYQKSYEDLEEAIN